MFYSLAVSSHFMGSSERPEKPEMSASIKEIVSHDHIMQLCHTSALFMPLFNQVRLLLHLNDSVIVNISHDNLDGSQLTCTGSDGPT